MQTRKDPLVNNECYHIYTRSISKFVIFNSKEEYQRYIEIMDTYGYEDFNYKYSIFRELSENAKSKILKSLNQDSILVKIVAYCLMPTHIHLILQQVCKNGISKYMSRLLNSYTRYFNIKHKRLGPLWAGRFKSVLVEKQDQLLHLTRYIHLNPTSAGLVKNPEDWIYSSYLEYIKMIESENRYLCNFNQLIDMSAAQYKKFTNDQKSYQRKISKIKSILIDNYTG